MVLKVLLLSFVNDWYHRRNAEEMDDARIKSDEEIFYERMEAEIAMRNDLFEEMEAEYMHDVEHGWECAWEQNYFREGPWDV